MITSNNNLIIANPKSLKYIYKTTGDEVYKLIVSILPSNYNTYHNKIYQDDDQSYDELPLPTKFN